MVRMLIQPPERSGNLNLAKYPVPFAASVHISQLVNAPLHWHLKILAVFCEVAFCFLLFKALDESGSVK
ncbi:hypothetical protein KEJ18_02350 [Candidatus Bathyarchaeota archaeon]|nr:hypothetical protein [Candidatus Bathyarchaeota archaeon]